MIAVVLRMSLSSPTTSEILCQVIMIEIAHSLLELAADMNLEFGVN